MWEKLKDVPAIKLLPDRERLKAFAEGSLNHAVVFCKRARAGDIERSLEAALVSSEIGFVIEVGILVARFYAVKNLPLKYIEECGFESKADVFNYLAEYKDGLVWEDTVAIISWRNPSGLYVDAPFLIDEIPTAVARYTSLG